MSDAVARPNLFNIRKRYTRIECEEKDYEGLWAEVRTNLSHDERGEFVEKLAQLSVDGKDHFTQMLNRFTDAQQRQIEAEKLVLEAAEVDDPDERAAAKELAQSMRVAANDAVWNAQQELITANSPEIVANRARHWELVSPYIRAWNICDENDADVPPPCESGDDALQYLDTVITSWLTSEVERGYRGGKGVRTSSSGSASTPAPTNGPQLGNEKGPNT